MAIKTSGITKTAGLTRLSRMQGKPLPVKGPLRNSKGQPFDDIWARAARPYDNRLDPRQLEIQPGMQKYLKQFESMNNKEFEDAFKKLIIGESSAIKGFSPLYFALSPLMAFLDRLSTCPPDEFISMVSEEPIRQLNSLNRADVDATTISNTYKYTAFIHELANRWSKKRPQKAERIPEESERERWIPPNLLPGPRSVVPLRHEQLEAKPAPDEAKEEKEPTRGRGAKETAIRYLESPEGSWLKKAAGDTFTKFFPLIKWILKKKLASETKPLSFLVLALSYENESVSKIRNNFLNYISACSYIQRNEEAREELKRIYSKLIIKYKDIRPTSRLIRENMDINKFKKLSGENVSENYLERIVESFLACAEHFGVKIVRGKRVKHFMAMR